MSKPGVLEHGAPEYFFECWIPPRSLQHDLDNFTATTGTYLWLLYDDRNGVYDRWESLPYVQ